MVPAVGLLRKFATSRPNASSPESPTGNVVAAAMAVRRRAQAAQYDARVHQPLRRVDTRHTVARLLHDRLRKLRVRSFLDCVSMRPGDRLVGRIDEGIRQCRVAVAIFSEHYLDSAFCLHELASLVEARKLIIPIFYGVKPSRLVLPPAATAAAPNAHGARDVERFRAALREAKYTVGLTYELAEPSPRV